MNDIVSMEEVSVIETEDGQKWVNVDDLIITLHFQRENLSENIEEELSGKDNFIDKEMLDNEISVVKDVYDTFIQSLEEIIEQFDQQ